MSALAQFLLAGIGTYAIRVSAIVVAGRRPPPSERTTAVLRLIAPAVLAAIVANSIFLDRGAWTVRLDWWVAGVVAGLAAIRWRSAGITMAGGMVAVWVVGLVV